jgi:hypothetical protein
MSSFFKQRRLVKTLRILTQAIPNDMKRKDQELISPTFSGYKMPKSVFEHYPY